MGTGSEKNVQYLVADTTAFIQNAPLQDIAQQVVTCPEVVEEIKNKRQLRRLVVLPYDLVVKEVFPENVKIITDFAKKTGDYPSLSATDIKVMALTYQLHKEKVGIDGLRVEPIMQKPMVTTEKPVTDISPDVTGFFVPGKTKPVTDEEVAVEHKERREPFTDGEEEIAEKLEQTDLEQPEQPQKSVHDEHFTDADNKKLEQTNEKTENLEHNIDDVLIPVKDTSDSTEYESDEDDEDDDDDEGGWITPQNVKIAKKQVNSQLLEEKHVTVACITTDFAMQNVLRQMNLNVSALDGRLIKHLRTYVLRCYACFKTTSIMTKKFCPKCGNDTLKKVAVSLDENGKMVIHINPKRPLTGRGKKYSLPKIKGGKHPNNPILVEDQPMPDNRPSRLARTKNDPLDDDYIAGFSPFIMRDINSKSALLGIRPGQEFKYWMKKNPNETRKRRK